MDNDTKTYFVMAENRYHAVERVKAGRGYLRANLAAINGGLDYPLEWSLFKVVAKRVIGYTATEIE